ncbi:MAG TPA: sigma-70 family RNA polymerase sigma factor [Chloroflexota bacterium]|jgi:RNA polymerase sigma-70 factor (ECF subfamily)|nr:sigma-70 family RNA polymerase sigma factor [Chloroflexota bacterium]
MLQHGVVSHQETPAVPLERVPSGPNEASLPPVATEIKVGAAEIQLQDDLIRRAKDGDLDALSQIHEQYAERVYRYFLSRLDGRTQQAEDLASEVFLRMLQRLDSYECRGLPFSAWLFRIAHNLLVDYIRRQPCNPLLTLEAINDAPAPLAELELDRVTDQGDLAWALSQLTGAQQEILELRFIQGWSIAETMAVLGKTEDAVKKLQARGLVKLRRLLLDSRSLSTASDFAVN